MSPRSRFGSNFLPDSPRVKVLGSKKANKQRTLLRSPVYANYGACQNDCIAQASQSWEDSHDSLPDNQGREAR